jgi:hypothetical protein
MASATVEASMATAVKSAVVRASGVAMSVGRVVVMAVLVMVRGV